MKLLVVDIKCHFKSMFNFLAHRETKDYGKENFHKIKQIQKANKEKQIEATRSTPVRAVYKYDKYEHVQSKVAEIIQVNYFKTNLIMLKPVVVVFLKLK